MVFLYEPDHFDQVYRSEDLVAPSRPGFETLVYYRTTLRKSTYDGVYGLTTAQDMQWRDFRTKVNPALLKPKLVKLYTPVLEEIADDMVARLQSLNNDAYLQENLDLEITKWSLESIAVIALGTRLGCLEDNLTEDHPARVLIKCAQDVINLSFKLEFMPSLWKYYPTSNYKKIIKTFDLQWDTSVKFIEEARKIIKDRAHELPEEDKSIIEKLLAIDEKVATVMANEMLFAGIDTVAFTTVALLYNLAINPKVQDKVRQEIRSSEPNKRYLKACLKESLRLYPVIPANLRRTTKDHFVGGYHIPKGVDVIAPNEFLSRLDKYYPQALEFIPERWLVDKSDPLYYGNSHPMVTLPFGFGVRSCIGRRIAELEIEVFMKRLLNDVKVTWEGPPVQVISRVMNAFKKPYHFKFETAT
ncbi:cytochrome P450 CYP12A2-like isoform X2 [Maniola jurtina]|nr:cytochrome P450 CYP12A2-like isoform X2 [Maniola jurtina]